MSPDPSARPAAPDRSEDVFAPSDRRLAPAGRMIREGRIDYLSLDIFDTTIYRHVPEPRNVFLLLGHALARKGFLRPVDVPESFAIARETAEHQARVSAHKSRGTGEVGIRDIYARMSAGRFAAPLDDIMALEHETEYRLCHPNRDIFALIDLARRHGVRIAFVSDTYFDADFLMRLLRKGDPALVPDILLASQEHSAAKAKGLFDVLLRKTGADPKRILHMGDNPRADIAPARRAGLRTLYLRKAASDFTEILAGEWGDTFARQSPLLDPVEGDFGLTWMRSRFAFAASRPLDSAARFWRAWGACVIGPVLTLFIDWAAARARALTPDGRTPRLLCLMREGWLFKRLLAIRAPDVAAHETWINRYASMKASLLDGAADSIAKFVERPHPPTIHKICKELGVPVPPGVSPETEMNREAVPLFQEYLKLPQVSRALKAEIGRVHKNLLRHMKKIGDFEKGSRLLLLDLGYAGTIQRGLQKILDTDGKKIETYGLYLATSELSTIGNPAVMAEGWMMTGGLPADLSNILRRSPEPLEQACMPASGTLVEHDSMGDPVCEDNRLPDWQIRQAAWVQDGILDFARACPPLPADNPHLIAQARRMLIRALALPTLDEAMRVGSWLHDENLGHHHTRPLAFNEKMGPIGHLPLHAVIRVPNPSLPWIFAAARRHSDVMSKRLYAIYTGAADANLFAADDGAMIHASVLADFGQGFSAKDMRLVPTLRTDRGIVEILAGLSCADGPPVALAIRLGAAVGDAVSPLRFCLFTEDSDRERVAHHQMTTPEDFRSLESVGLLALAPGIFKVVEPNAAFFWRAPQRLAIPKGMAGVEFSYSLMKTA